MTAIDHEILRLLAEDFQMSERVIADGEEVIPRFRIFTPDGEFLILVQMLHNVEDHKRRIRLVAGFMLWKMATAFVVSGETVEPDAVFSVYVSRKMTFGQMWLVERATKTFGQGAVLLEGDCDPAYRAMLPAETAAMDETMLEELRRAFGNNGEVIRRRSH